MIRGLLFSIMALATGLYMIMVLVEAIVDTPYMDEIFHVRQSQAYCMGDWHVWDNKITTFPGLYILASIAVRFIGAVLSTAGVQVHQPCTLFLLRFINIPLVLLLFLLVFHISDSVRPASTPLHHLMVALMITLYPLNFFFYFLHYTDVPALVFMMGGLLVLLHNEVQQSISPTLKGVKAYVMEVTQFVRAVIQSFPTYMWKIYPLATVIGVVVYYLWALGPVLGDKEAHTMRLHLMQMPYCALTLTAALAPYHFAPQRLLRFASLLTYVPSFLLFLISTQLTVLLIRSGTYIHPYILADNRHYTFYLWHKLLGRYALVRYGLAPVYVYSWWSILTALVEGGMGGVWVTGWVAAVGLSVVPAGLVELRYFTVPYVFLAVHQAGMSYRQLCVTCAAYFVVNVVTLYVFLGESYTWGDGSVARFMW